MKDSNKSVEKTSRIAHRKIEHGHTQNLLLLHGFLGSQHIWDPLLSALSKSFNVITVDLPGHGKSPCHEEMLTMAQMAQWVIELLDELQLKQTHIVGHSMGGYVGLEMLNHSPQRVQSLTLLNSTAAADSDEKKADRLRAVKVFDLSPRVYIREAITNLFYPPKRDELLQEVERLQEIALQTTVEGAKACLRGMRERHPFVELVNTSRVPIQYLAGVHDTTVPYPSIVEQITGDQVQLVSFKNSGHMSFAEEKVQCINSIVNFIDAL